MILYDSLNNGYVEGSCILSLYERVSALPAPKSVVWTVGFDLCSDIITSFAKNHPAPKSVVHTVPTVGSRIVGSRLLSAHPAPKTTVFTMILKPGMQKPQYLQ